MLGCQRSGTTLLATILHDASGGAFGVEAGVIRLAFIWFHNLCAIPAAFNNLRMVEFLHALNWSAHAAGQPKRTRWSQAAEAVLTGYLKDGRLRNWAKRNDLPAFLRNLCRDVHGTMNPQATFWGDKYPQYLFHVGQIEQVFPRARYVFLQRHPHPVMESLYRLRNPTDRPGGGLRFDMEDCRDQWVEWNRLWLRTREAIEPARRFELAFEALLENPRDVLSRLERFLGVNLLDHPQVESRLAMIDPGKRSQWLGSPHASLATGCPVTPEFTDTARLLGYPQNHRAAASVEAAPPLHVLCLFDQGSRFPLMICEGLLGNPAVRATFNKDVVSLGRILARGTTGDALAALGNCDLVFLGNREFFSDPTLLRHIEALSAWPKVVFFDFKDSPEIDEEVLGKCLAYFKRSMARGLNREPLPVGARPVYPLDFGVLEAYLEVLGPIRDRRSVDVGFYFDPAAIAGSTRRGNIHACLMEEDWGGATTRIGRFTAGGAIGRRNVFYGVENNPWADYMRLLGQTRIVFSATQDGWDGDSRTWEALASGALCCLDVSSIAMPDPLEHGRHCLRYDARSRDSIREVVRLARQLLRPEFGEERRAMAARGRDLAVKRHGSRARVAYMLDIVSRLQRQ